MADSEERVIVNIEEPLLKMLEAYKQYDNGHLKIKVQLPDTLYYQLAAQCRYAKKPKKITLGCYSMFGMVIVEELKE